MKTHFQHGLEFEARLRTASDTELVIELDRLNEEIKAIGNILWYRGNNWHELANRIYHGAKQVWIARSIFNTYVTRVANNNE